MTSWAEVERAAPAFAEQVRKTFAVRKHATMATTRRDGSPRISGTEVDFTDDGEIYLGMMQGAKRAADLRRDPRMALHSPTVDPPEGAEGTWLGESKLTARAVEVESHRFRLDIGEVVFTHLRDGLEITLWRASGEVEVFRR